MMSYVTFVRDAQKTSRQDQVNKKIRCDDGKFHYGAQVSSSRGFQEPQLTTIVDPGRDNRARHESNEPNQARFPN
jgi:hypothetical protein